MTLADDRAALTRIVLEHGYRRMDEPIELASGQMNRDFVDGKRALARGDDLALACRAMAALAEHHGADWTAAGGLTMGADQFAHGLAIVTGRQWFVCRKEPKARGTRQQVEGAQIGPGTAALVVEDAVSTGGSLLKALDLVEATGASIAFVTTLVDRGDLLAPVLEARGIRYEPLLTYRDLGIEPIVAAA